MARQIGAAAWLALILKSKKKLGFLANADFETAWKAVTLVGAERHPAFM